MLQVSSCTGLVEYLRNVGITPGDNLDEKEGNHRKYGRCRIVLFGKAGKTPETHWNDDEAA